MMRLLCAALALFAGAAFPVSGQVNPEETLLIPTPDGAVIVTEMNANREQIIQQLQFMAMFSQSEDDGDFNPDWAKLADALGTIERVQYAEMETEGAYSPAEVIGFFQSQVSGQRVFYNVNPETGGGLLLLSLQEGQSYFFTRIKAIKDDEGKTTGAKITAVRTFGAPDAEKLAEMAGEMLISTIISAPLKIEIDLGL